MKIAIWALLLVGLYFIYEYSIGSIFREYQSCYDKSETQLRDLTGTPASICVARKLVYEEMNQCIASVQNQKNVATFLYRASSVKGNLEKEYVIHNDDCPANKITPPTDNAFYLSTGSKR